MEENKEKIDIPLPGSEPASESASYWDFIFEMVKFTVISLLIVAPIRFFIAQPFLVSGNSMSPTFEDGEYLIIDELSYFLKSPSRGQVVVFRYPNDPSKHFIKRIVGLPGETVIIEDGKVVIKNAENPDGFRITEDYVKNYELASKSIKTTLSEKEYFVMGDNRPSSSDSRDWGPVPRENLTGSVILRLFPFTKVSYEPGIK